MRQRSDALCTRRCFNAAFSSRLNPLIIDASQYPHLSIVPREKLSAWRKKEGPTRNSLKLLRHISLCEVGGCCAPSLAIERQRWRQAVARRLRNLREPRRERLHQQLSQLAARAFSAGGGRPIHKWLAKGRPDTRFRARSGGSGTREQREQSEEAHYAVCCVCLLGR